MDCGAVFGTRDGFGGGGGGGRTGVVGGQTERPRDSADFVSTQQGSPPCCISQGDVDVGFRAWMPIRIGMTNDMFNVAFF